MSEATWSVGRVAKRSGLNVSTLHFYEQKGLISSWRNDGNQRRYSADVLRRISIIKSAQKMGISLEDIRLAFASLPNNRTPTQEDWQSLSQHWHYLLTPRIHYLEKLRDYLTGCIGCGCLSMKKCPLYNANDHLASEGTGAVILERELQSASIKN